MLASAGLRLRFKVGATFGAAVGDESQAFPMHGCLGERRSCSDPCVEEVKSEAKRRGGEMGGCSKNGRAWRDGVFQNAVGEGGGDSELAGKKGNARQRAGRFCHFLDLEDFNGTVDDQWIL